MCCCNFAYDVKLACVHFMHVINWLIVKNILVHAVVTVMEHMMWWRFAYDVKLACVHFMHVINWLIVKNTNSNLPKVQYGQMLTSQKLISQCNFL